MCNSRNKAILILCLLLTILMLATAPAMADQAAVFTIGSSSYTVNGQPYTMDVSPFVQDGRTYVPVRYLADSMGLIVAWNPKTQVVELSLNTDNAQLKTDVQMTIGSPVLWIGINKTFMDVSPIIVNGRTMLPARWVAEAFDSNVTWDAGSQTVTISPNYHPPVLSGPNVQPADQGNDQVIQSGIATITPTPAYITPAYITPITPTITPAIDAPVSVNQVDEITLLPLYPYEIVTNQYTWSYGGKRFTWKIGVPYELYKKEAFVQVPRLGVKWVLDLITLHPQQCQLDELIKDADSVKYIDQVANELNQAAYNQGYDRFHKAEFIASFVQNIPYRLANNNVQYPPQVIANGGSCINTSVLLASILRQLGYPVSIFIFQQELHATAGIGFEIKEISKDRYTDHYLFTGLPEGLTCYTRNGVNYYFIDTVTPGARIGESSMSPLPAGFSQPTVYPIQ